MAGRMVPINENGITYGESLPSREYASIAHTVKNIA